MMDVIPPLTRDAEKLADIEALVTQTAKARFEISVTSVYWRADTTGAGAAARRVAAEPSAAAPQPTPASTAPSRVPAARPEPLQEDEVMAFRRALMSASGGPSTADARGHARSGPHSYTLLTGFEDTEMPEPSSAPALSATQYGDLN